MSSRPPPSRRAPRAASAATATSAPSAATMNDAFKAKAAISNQVAHDQNPCVPRGVVESQTQPDSLHINDQREERNDQKVAGAILTDSRRCRARAPPSRTPSRSGSGTSPPARSPTSGWRKPGSPQFGPNLTLEDPDQTIDPDERLKLPNLAPPGTYDAKVTLKDGRTCHLAALKIDAGAIVRIDEKDLRDCAK